MRKLLLHTVSRRESRGDFICKWLQEDNSLHRLLNKKGQPSRKKSWSVHPSRSTEIMNQERSNPLDSRVYI